MPAVGRGAPHIGRDLGQESIRVKIDPWKTLPQRFEASLGSLGL